MCVTSSYNTFTVHSTIQLNLSVSLVQYVSFLITTINGVTYYNVQINLIGPHHFFSVLVVRGAHVFYFLCLLLSICLFVCLSVCLYVTFLLPLRVNHCHMFNCKFSLVFHPLCRYIEQPKMQHVQHQELMQYNVQVCVIFWSYTGCNENMWDMLEV